mgnify:CR=1 FL=1
MKKNFVFVYITASTKKEAKEIAKILISEKLAACCNIFKVDSFFWWKNKILSTKEFGMFVKTKNFLIEKIIKRVKKIHSYSLPCIVSFGIQKGNKGFLNWVEKTIEKPFKINH